MDFKVLITYIICDDLLHSLSFKDDPQCLMSTAEIMTVGIVSALFYGGNVQQARRFLDAPQYIPSMLSHSRLHRRLIGIPPDYWRAALFLISHILSLLKKVPTEYIIDSCPLPVCQPCRSWCCKLYKGKEYLGYCAAKKLHYYGLKLHIIVSEEGIIHECILTPASYSDVRAFKMLEIDLPADSYLYADRAYNSKELEEELKDERINLIPERKVKSKRQHSGALTYLQRSRRKRVETVFSCITRFMPRALSVRSARGFEMRQILFVIAYAIQYTLCPYMM
jgi:hypothetical protein